MIVLLANLWKLPHCCYNLLPFSLSLHSLPSLYLSLHSLPLSLPLTQREKDLEVAAKIGQALLRRNELLEADLSAAADTKLQSEQQVHHHAE